MVTLAAAPTSVLTEDLLERCAERAAAYDRENRFFTEDFAMIAVSTWDTREHADFSRDALISVAGVSAGPDPDAERRIADAGYQMDTAEIYKLAAEVSRSDAWN